MGITQNGLSHEIGRRILEKTLYSKKLVTTCGKVGYTHDDHFI